MACGVDGNCDRFRLRRPRGQGCCDRGGTDVIWSTPATPAMASDPLPTLVDATDGGDED